MVHLSPHLENAEVDISFTHRLVLPNKEVQALNKAQFFAGRPPVGLA
jgi:hypothetical protein